MASTKRARAGRRPTAERPSRRSPAAKSAKKKASAPFPKSTKKSPGKSDLARLREICLAFPGAHEVEAWGEPTFRVKNKVFAMYASPGTHHSPDRPSVWILSVNMEQDLVLRTRPDRYFKPAYVGPAGWIGAWLDRKPPWGEIAELLRDGYERRKRR